MDATKRGCQKRLTTGKCCCCCCCLGHIIVWMSLFLSWKCLGSTLLSRPLLVACHLRWAFNLWDWATPRNVKSEASTEPPWMGGFECLECVLFFEGLSTKVKVAWSKFNTAFFLHLCNYLETLTGKQITRSTMDVQRGIHFKSIILISVVSFTSFSILTQILGFQIDEHLGKWNDSGLSTSVGGEQHSNSEKLRIWCQQKHQFIIVGNHDIDDDKYHVTSEKCDLMRWWWMMNSESMMRFG